MKRLIIVILCLAFAKPEFTTAQIFVDHKNAPENPYGIYYGCYECKGYKNDVYHTEFDWYDRDGNMIGEKRLPKEYDAENPRKTYVELKNGLVLSKTFGEDDKTIYTYDHLNRLTLEDNKFYKHTYSYDERNRLIKNISYDKANNTVSEITREYATKNGILKIEKTITRDGVTNTSSSSYKNGFIVENINSFGNSYYTYTYDNKGNWIKQTITGSKGDVRHRERSIIYWSDLNKIIDSKEIAWETAPISNGVGAVFPYPKINGKTVKNAFINSRSLANGILYYLDSDQTYYYGKNAFSKDTFARIKGKATEVSRGSEAVLHRNEGYVALFYRGTRIKFTTQRKIETNYYLYHEPTQQHFLVSDYRSENGFYPAQVLYGDQSIYYYNAEKESYRIFENGQEIDYSTIDKLKKTASGDQVIIKNGTPVSVLKNSRNKPKKLERVRPYVKGDNKASNTIVSAAKFNPSIPITVKKTGDTSYLFYQTGAEIEFPSYFNSTSGNQDLILGYGLNDYVIYDYKAMKIGSSKVITQIAKENEIIIMYLDGKASYFYNNGVPITKEDYVLKKFGSDQWIIYLKKLNKTIFVDINVNPSIRYKPSLSYEQNSWAYKLETGLVIYENGKNLDPNSFKFYADAAGNAVVYINEKPKYYIKDYTTKPANSSSKLEKYFGQTYVKSNETVKQTSEFTAAFIKAQEGADHSKQTKKMLSDMGAAMNNKGLSAEEKTKEYTQLMNELYDRNKEYAFELMMNVDTKRSAQLMKSLPREKRDFFRNRAKKELSKYKGAHTGK